ncbi:hypothetical protein [Agrobacterium sp. MS2]|uniref:hypothetical protein n=1 Tax=Agrobacterium sp. MS2 TaxID=1345498 RepID=UPI000DBF8977|nr:hypothetical protein [Agrobacterium sp. MS2]RAL98707.1 hypothetical protein DOU54_06520 [Agrobacterium sp. MS2]
MTNRNWTSWNGGKFLPVPEDAIGAVMLRCGRVIEDVRAKDVLWGRAKREVAANDNDSNGGKIVAYHFTGEAA